jgi:hypothetical protein
MLKHASILISLALAGLYALGLTFHQGFLRELGIEETQFILALDRVFFQGFVSTMNMGSKGLVYLFLSAGGVVLVAEVGVLVGSWINRTDLYSKVRSIFVSQNNKQSSESSFGNFSAKAFAYLGLALFLFMLLLAALLLSDRSGGEYAKRFIANTTNGVLHKKLIELKSNEKSYKGYSIICSTLQCAYYIEGKAVVLNNRDIYRVTDLGKKP